MKLGKVAIRQKQYFDKKVQGVSGGRGGMAFLPFKEGRMVPTAPAGGSVLG